MMYRGQWSEWEALLRHRLLEQAGCASQERRFALRHNLAALYLRLHRTGGEHGANRGELPLGRGAGDRQLQADAAIHLSEAYLNADAARAGVGPCRGSRQPGLPRSNLPWKEADGLIDAGRALLAQGELAEAEQRLRRAETLAATDGLSRSTRPRRGCSWARWLVRSGCWQEALAHFEIALGLVTSYGDEVGRATVQISMGRALAELGRLDDAACLLEDAVRVHRRHGNLPAERVAVQRLQEVMARRSASEEAWHDGICRLTAQRPLMASWPTSFPAAEGLPQSVAEGPLRQCRASGSCCRFAEEAGQTGDRRMRKLVFHAKPPGR